MLTLYLAKDEYYYHASHAVSGRTAARSTMPTFVEKFQDRFEYTPSRSPYFTNSLSPEPAHRPSGPIPLPSQAANAAFTQSSPITTTTNYRNVSTYSEE